jgi:hypothetical protein
MLSPTSTLLIFSQRAAHKFNNTLRALFGRVQQMESLSLRIICTSRWVEWDLRYSVAAEATRLPASSPELEPFEPCLPQQKALLILSLNILPPLPPNYIIYRLKNAALFSGS